nr:MAG: concanavalin A-like lectin/glucanase domain superfamily [Helarchaeota virus Nidhogg Meg22_1012]
MRGVFTTPYLKTLLLDKIGSVSIVSNIASYTYVTTVDAPSSLLLKIFQLNENDVKIRISYDDENLITRTVEHTIERNTLADEYLYVDLNGYKVRKVNDVTIIDGTANDGTWEFYTLSWNNSKLFMLCANFLSEMSKTNRDIMMENFIDYATTIGLERWGQDLDVAIGEGWSEEIYRTILKAIRSFHNPSVNSLYDLINSFEDDEFFHIFELHDGEYQYNGGITNGWLLYATHDMPTSFEIQRVVGQENLTDEQLSSILDYVRPVNTHYSITHPIPEDADEWTDTDFRDYQVQLDHDSTATPICDTTYNVGQTISNVRTSPGMVLRVRKVTNSYTPSFDYYRELSLTESNGVDRTDEVIVTSVSSITSGNCYHDSIRVYNRYSTETEITSQVFNKIHDTFDTDHNFTSSTDWSDPTGWTVSETVNSSVQVLPHFMGHKKVVEMYYDGSGYMSLTDTFASSQVDEVIEFWIRIDDATNGGFAVNIDSSSTNAILFAIYQGKWQYYDGSSWNDVGENASSDTWYHVKCDFDCDTDTYSLTINNGTTHASIPFRNSVSNVDKITFDRLSGNSYTAYVGAVDYSWETDYYDGRIKYLTSFDVAFLADVSANSTEYYRIYYHSSSKGDPGYTGISRSGNEVTCSDNTTYLLESSTTSRLMGNTQEDKNGVDWALYTNYFNSILNLFDSNQSPIWLEDGAVFCEGVFYESSNEYAYFTFYDNDLIKETWKADAVHTTDYVHDYDVGGTFVDYTRLYYNNDWQSHASGDGNTNYVIQTGKIFWDDSGDKEIIYVWLYSITDESKNVLVYSNQVDRVILNIGHDGSDTLLANTEYEVWHGFRDVGSTSFNLKKSYVDDLYTEVVSNPLTQSLTSENSEDTITEFSTSLKIEVYEWDTDYSTTIAAPLVTSGEIDFSDVQVDFQDIQVTFTDVDLDETKTYLIHVYTTGGNATSDPEGYGNYYEIRYQSGNPYPYGSAYQNGSEI